MKFDKLTEAYMKVLESDVVKLQHRQVSEEEYNKLMGMFPKVKEDKYQAPGHEPLYWVEYVGTKDAPLDHIKPHRFVYEFVARF